MKKLLYTGIALLGAMLSNLSHAHDQLPTPSANLNLDLNLLAESTVNKKVKPIVFSDVVKNNKNFTLAWHSSHYSHSSHSSHYSHVSHRSGY